ncbi:EscD/YscD/HrpQ family type III secretion system inner membrane ring protein [Salmonella enterica]|uniref:EscD/YscD/HrpQ family type III secretion system inner membrane ring protein n=1 Tax=Salmonella diarizonae TaxID=59204 RepID=A0A5Y1Y439_SALDZ|nr:EscD/YscD/HrpQ family type III secretion system inner membrane ring protein [Salmonella enterica]ECC3913186.1 EscD/YscD/HrpQ family type III secretion system inner membrane ring protein [Salmonella enterica subsp. diarizonae]ECG8570938.1 EscD/YscD/HrpQ family type III secretion system inner membrane ring protein [Salmonella enterica subsp. diarizonae]ECJ5883401.1 EscD/YscD/HrpQ family type III secretion system inner membrane ring protein [Salmonella enterica subsp. diarizonae]EDX5482529.1 Es
MDYVYKIKFLNSSLVGRELLLREGIFSIGTGDCDVWLSLSESEEKQIEFDISSQGISLTKTTKIWRNGIEGIALAGELLPLQATLDIAGIQFALGEMDSCLDSLIAVTRKNSTISSNHNRFIIILIIVMVIASLVLMCGTGYLIHNARARENSVLPDVEVQKKLVELENQHVLPGVKFVWEKNDVVNISGQCKSEKLLQPVLDFLKNNDTNYILDVICDDRLIQNVMDALQINGFDRVFAYMDKAPGKVIISGQIEEDQRWQRVVKLLNDMQGLRSWSVKSVNDKELDELISDLRKLKLLPMLSIQRVDDRIIVSGRLNLQERNSLYTLIRHHMLSYPGTQEIIYQNINTSSSSLGILPAPVASIGGNSDFPYVILDDGTRLQKGAVLPGGYQIVNIDSINGIELTKRGELLHLPLGL